MESFFQGRSGGKVKGASGDSASKSAQQKRSKERKSLPWVEKYRPKVVDDVIHQEEVVSVLKKVVSGSDLPNLLFYGPPGTGKTSAILAVARELFSSDIFKSRVLELNASDDRGIQVIREKVKTFAQHTVSAVKPDGKKCPPFKIIILDEADSMTHSAQAALRRTMEKESKTTRFCLICNYISRIIEPLTSRCSKFRFKPLSTEVMKRRLEYICTQEQVKCNDKALDVIIDVSEGDMRKAITFLQSVHQLCNSDQLNEHDVTDVAGVVPADFMEDLMRVCQSNSYDQLEAAIKNITAEGYSAVQILNQVHDVIVTHTVLTDVQKSVICERLGLIDKRLSDGADEYIQLLDLFSVIMTQFCQVV